MGSKKPDELQVLFLCGPNPMNDLQILLDLGVSPYNIWAIESDAALFENAARELRNNRLGIKLHRGKLEQFFGVIPQQFDLVYFDACGPLFGGKPNTISVIRELFLNQRLAPLSALITTFSNVNMDGNSSLTWARRFATWYAIKYIEPVDSNSEAEERISNLDGGRYHAHIETNLEDYYSDFITRFIIEFAGQLLAWWRVTALPGARRDYFAEPIKLQAAIEASLGIKGPLDRNNIFKGFGHALSSPTSYPYLLTSEYAKENLPDNDPLKDFLFKTPFISTRLDEAIRATSLVRKFYQSYFGGGEHNREASSAELAEVLDKFRWFDTGGSLFCDLPLPNLFVDLLMGLYGYPYHTNLGKTLRYKYTAKATPMYTDVFIFDQARYLYDLLPTLATFDCELDFASQLILRICIDGIGRHSYHGCPNLYWGSSLACIGEEGFDVYKWPARVTLEL